LLFPYGGPNERCKSQMASAGIFTSSVRTRDQYVGIATTVLC
jgi:hypothetical protein